MSLIFHSQHESNQFGLKIGRSGMLGQFNTVELREEILKEKYDVVRLRLLLDNQSLFKQLSDLKISYHLFKIMIRFSVNCQPNIKFNRPELSFQLYNGSQETDLRSVIKELIETPTEKGYFNILFDGFLNESQANKSSIEYYLQYFNNAIANSNIQCSMAYIGNECVGFIGYDVQNEISEGVFYGVINKHRAKGYAHELITSARINSYHLGAKEFSADTIMYNIASISPQIKAGFLPTQTYANVILYSMLSASSIVNTELYVVSINNLIDKMQSWLREQENENYVINEMLTAINFSDKVIKIVCRLFELNKNTKIIIANNINNDYGFFMLDKK